MEGVPLFNQEDNSEDTGSEFGADGKPKKKSKKKSAPEWFQRIVNTGEEQPEEESRTGRLLDLIKSPFSKLFGIEKDELPEGEAGADDEDSSDSEFRFPLMDGSYTALDSVEPEQPELAHDPADNEPELPQGLIIDEDTAEEFASWEAPLNREDDRFETNPGSDEVEATGQEVIDTSVPEELSVDQLRAEVEAHALASSETPTERTPYTNSYDSATRGEAVATTKEREVIIENRGGAGAAAVGFVAADLLSRSRDRKIRKEADQLKKKVATLENKQKDDNFKAREAEVKNKERIRDLAVKREIDVRRQNEKIKSVNEVQSSRPDVLQPQRVEIPWPAVESSEPIIERAPDSDHNRPEYKVLATERQSDDALRAQELLARQNQELLATIEKAKQVSYAGETYYDRQHEVMDEPTQYDMASGGSITGRSSQPTAAIGSQMATGQAQSQSVPTAYEPLPQKTGLSDEYKQAMVQGATTGIILLVGFLIVLILWSLL